MTSKRSKQDNLGVLPPLISLKCTLCEHYLKDPVTLPCLHSFCRTCLETYNARRVLAERDQARRERGGSETSEDGSFDVEAKEKEAAEDLKKLKLGQDLLNVHCPTCIETLGLAPPVEPQVPFENSRLARIVGLVHDANIVCQNCSQATSELKCVTCNAWLCNDCKDVTHAAPIFATHELQRLTHAEMMALPKCEAHPMNDLEFFSTDEEVGVCQVCLLKGDFVGKPYCLVSDVRRARQSEIERGVKVVLEEKERLMLGRQKMQQVLEQLDKKLRLQSEDVKANFQLIREAIDKREKEVLESLTELKNAKSEVLSNQMNQTDHILGVINDGVRNVKLVLHHSNDLELVYLTIVLQEYVAELAKLDGQKFKSVEHALDFFHSAAVNAELPVLLSDKIAGLVSAYAPVPKATIPAVNKQAAGPGNKVVPLNIEKNALTKQQKVLLDEVGAQGNAEEYGCSIQ